MKRDKTTPRFGAIIVYRLRVQDIAKLRQNHCWTCPHIFREGDRITRKRRRHGKYFCEDCSRNKEFITVAPAQPQSLALGPTAVMLTPALSRV